jgi:hypothetical protein
LFEAEEMSYSTDLAFEAAVKTVTTAGTREVLATGSQDKVRVRALVIRALDTNGGLVYVGKSNVLAATPVGYPLRPGETLKMKVSFEGWQKGEAINMSNVYLDVETSGEGVAYAWLK